jgi:tetratricopeptide (TPR) repeat protein
MDSPDGTAPDRPPFLTRTRILLAVVLVALVAGAGMVGYVWWKKTRLPQPGNPIYEEYAEAFEVGVAALDVGVGDVAVEYLTRAITLIPQEPAAWADRGLYYLRSRQFPQAAADLAQAEKRAPDNPDVQTYLGLMEEQQGRYTEAIGRFRKVAEKNPRDVEALYALARLSDKEHNAGSDDEYQRLMEKILAVRPENRLVLVERLRVAVRRSDRARSRTR